jgi:hypothetical protein
MCSQYWQEKLNKLILADFFFLYQSTVHFWGIFYATFVKFSLSILGRFSLSQINSYDYEIYFVLHWKRQYIFFKTLNYELVNRSG